MASKRRYPDRDEDEDRRPSLGLGFSQTRDEEDRKPSMGLGFSQPKDKKPRLGGGTLGAGAASMNFINFTKAGTNLDGSKSRGERTYIKEEEDPRKRAAKDASELELVGDISRREQAEGARWIQRFHDSLKKAMNSSTAEKNSVTTNFNNTVQVNPEIIFVHENICSCFH